MIEVERIISIPERVRNILIEEGQKDRRFHLGDTIKYDPVEVCEILKKHEEELK